MKQNNYELFNEIAGKILANLLKSIPIESSDSVYDVTGYGGECKSIDDAPHEWKVFRKTVLWLHDEGFIRIGLSETAYKQREYYFIMPKATLTYKGLEALKSIPDPLNSKSGLSLADTLIEGAKDGAKGKMADLTKQALSVLFTAITQV